MGSTRWSDDHYDDRVKLRAATGVAAFGYHDDVKTGKTANKVHDKLDAKRLSSLGAKLRDSRDSDAHPESHGVAIVFDVTGSMGEVPRILQKNLPKLMGLLMRKGYLEHPSIMISAVGDATCDHIPLQIGNFEAGIEIENDLTNIVLEGGGGGHITESYELAMYYLAKYTAMDNFEKRNKKGYLFIIGDETPYPEVDRRQVKDLIGDDLQENIPTADIVEELTRTYDVYYVLPHMTSNYKDHRVTDCWKKYFGQRILHLEDPNTVCELIASAVGVAEGKVDVDGVAKDLIDFGVSKSTASAVGKALVPVSAGALKVKGAEVDVPSSGAGSGVATL
jgi:hypothetical protein